MGSELSPSHSAFLDHLVSTGKFDSPQQAIERAMLLLREETETLEELREGLESVRRGEGTPLDEAIELIRSRGRLSELAP